jgi:hypothetical protein
MSEKFLYYAIFYFGFIICTGVSAVLYKKWAVSLIPMFIAGFFVSMLPETITYIPLFQLSVSYILLCIFLLLYLFFFIYRCLKIQNNTEVLKEKGIWLSVLAASVILTVFCLLFRGKTINAYNSYNIKLAKKWSLLGKENLSSHFVFFILPVFQLVVLSPVCEELIGREMVFKLIVKDRAQKIVFLLFILLAGITSLYHFNTKFLGFFLRWGLFTVLFFVRYRFPSNRQLWYCVLIHSLWNAGNVMYAVLFNTFQ